MKSMLILRKPDILREKLLHKYGKALTKVIVDKHTITGVRPHPLVQKSGISASVYLYCTKIMKVANSLPHLKALI